jgi:hypothetical protein
LSKNNEIETRIYQQQYDLYENLAEAFLESNNNIDEEDYKTALTEVTSLNYYLKNI